MSLRANLIDTHCHLDFPEFDSDRDEVITRSKAQGIEYIINVGSSLKGSEASLELARKYECIFAAIGIHPHEADSFSDKDVAAIKILAAQEKVVAIGEIGLDYYRNFSKSENQKRLFFSLTTLAGELNLPLVIHNRQAEADTLEILKKSGIKKGVVHCFSGDGDFLKECLDLGFLISFTCNITYKKAQNLREIIKLAPLEKILLETDAPYLSPEGSRGKRNEPLNVEFVAKQVAEIKGISIEEVALVTTANTKELFNLP